MGAWIWARKTLPQAPSSSGEWAPAQGSPKPAQTLHANRSIRSKLPRLLFRSHSVVLGGAVKEAPSKPMWLAKASRIHPASDPATHSEGSGAAGKLGAGSLNTLKHSCAFSSRGLAVQDRRPLRHAAMSDQNPPGSLRRLAGRSGASEGAAKGPQSATERL